jgi:hypothetical protein
MAIQDFTAGQVLTAAQMDSLQANDYNQTVSTKTASYTLVAADKGTRVVMNSASATTITVNTSLFSAGDTLYLQNIGAGVCTVTAGTATVSSAGPLAIPQYGSGTLYFTSAGVAIYFPSAVTAATVSSGLTFISRTTFTTAASTGITNVFSSTYDNYFITITNLIGSSSAGSTNINLGSSGSADTGANYDWNEVANQNGSGQFSQTLDTTKWTMNGSYTGQTGYPSQINMILAAPNLARPSTVVAYNFGNRDTVLKSATFAGAVITNTQYTDFFIIADSSQTLSGVCTIYGYSNS